MVVFLLILGLAGIASAYFWRQVDLRLSITQRRASTALAMTMVLLSSYALLAMSDADWSGVANEEDILLPTDKAWREFIQDHRPGAVDESPRESRPFSKLPAVVQKRLRATDDQAGWSLRQLSLLWFHDVTMSRFTSIVRTFGYGRLLPTYMNMVAREESQKVFLPSYEPIRRKTPLIVESAFDFSANSEHVRTAQVDHSRFPRLDEHDLMRAITSDEDFLDESVGYGTGLRDAARFKKHDFIPNSEGVELTTLEWKISRLELISLLKHKEPVVYTTTNVPVMDQLDDVPTGPLNSFEQHALNRLHRDEDLVIDDRGNDIQMVGAIRASKLCLRCHGVNEGELLGAFSYRLLPLFADSTGE